MKRGAGLKLIFDTKIRSPFGWDPKYSWDDRLELAIKYADIIAIQTMDGWGGYPGLITAARRETSKPILAKGFCRTDEEIVDLINLGATYVLVVGRVPANKYIDKCMLEPTCLREMEDYPKNAKVVWNARNLLTGLPKKETFEDALDKWQGWICQASMIKSLNEVHPDVDAVMVGTYMDEIIEDMKEKEE